MADECGGGGNAQYSGYSYEQLWDMAYADDPGGAGKRALQWYRMAEFLQQAYDVLDKGRTDLIDGYVSAGGAAYRKLLKDLADAMADASPAARANYNVWESVESTQKKLQSDLRDLDIRSFTPDEQAIYDKNQEKEQRGEETVHPKQGAAQALVTKASLDYDGLALDIRDLPVPEAWKDETGDPTPDAGDDSSGTPGGGGGGPNGSDPGGTPATWAPTPGRTGGSSRPRVDTGHTRRGTGARPTAPGTAPGSGRSPATPVSKSGAVPGAIGNSAERGGGSFAPVGKTLGGGRPSIGSGGSGVGMPPASDSARTTGVPGRPGGPGGAPGQTTPAGGPGGVPPGGGPHGGAGGPGDRRGQRRTHYEKLEPDTFRDTRDRVDGVIGEQRRQPDVHEAPPGTIGARKTSEDASKTPDLPTAEAPKRFEGHDVSFSRTRRSRGSQ